MSNLELRGALAVKKQKKYELSIRADGLIKGIKHLLAASAIMPISKIDVEQVDALSNDLLGIKREYVLVCDDIEKIEKELE